MVKIIEPGSISFKPIHCETGERPQGYGSTVGLHKKANRDFCSIVFRKGELPVGKSGVYFWTVNREVVFVAPGQNFKACIHSQVKIKLSQMAASGGNVTYVRVNANLNEALAAEADIELHFIETENTGAEKARLVAKYDPPWNKPDSISRQEIKTSKTSVKVASKAVSADVVSEKPERSNDRIAKRAAALSTSAPVDLGGNLNLLPYLEVAPVFQKGSFRPQDDIKQGSEYDLRRCCDRLYIELSLDAPNYSGCYLWVVGGRVVYVGQAQNFANRMRGYSKITWRNTCTVPTDKKRSYGQITNCRVNGNLHDAVRRDKLSVVVRFIRAANIDELETALRILYNPPWNVR